MKLPRWWPSVVGVLCAVPFAVLLRRVQNNDLGPNPVEMLTHFTGDWAIWFLLLSLSITPLRRMLNSPQLIRARKPLGLAAFAYGLMHLSVWAYFDKGLLAREMWSDVVARRFITAGMLALALMVPLAITSTAGWIRRLGGRNWQRLHRLVYISAIAGVAHYYWLVKSNVIPPLRLAAILAVLFAFRMVPAIRKSLATRSF